MTTKTELLSQILKQNLPDVRPGDTVRIHQKVKEGNKERIQVFEGVVIARKHGKGVSATITVRKVVQGVGVERIFPVHSPIISKIEIIARGKVRRAKLYFLRTAGTKKARLKRMEFSAAIAQSPQEAKESAVADTSESETAVEPTTEKK